MSLKYCIASYTHFLNGKHTNLGGPAQHLAKYLGKKAYCIWQPIPAVLPLWLAYILKIRDLGLVLGELRKAECFIGVESLNALVGVLGRKLGLFKRVIYWNMDYSPTRGLIWCFLDRLAIKYSDEVWVLKDRGLPKQKVVPIGYWKVKLTKQKRDGIVYIGLLEDTQGVGLLMQYAKIAPRTKVTIIGTGRDEQKYKDMKLPNVKFTGMLSDKEADKILAKHKYGWAKYHPNNPTIKTTMPTKPVTYRRFGLKIIGGNYPKKFKDWNTIFKETLND